MSQDARFDRQPDNHWINNDDHCLLDGEPRRQSWNFCALYHREDLVNLKSESTSNKDIQAVIEEYKGMKMFEGIVSKLQNLINRSTGNPVDPKKEGE